MKCPKCGSENVNVQAVSITKNKKHGVIYWLCFGWLIDLILWVCLFIPRLIIKIFGSKKIKTTVHSEAVCQNCGHRWKV